MRIIATDGGERSALAAVRSLVAAGHEVGVGAEFRPCLAGAARGVVHRFTYSDPGENADAFRADMRKEADSFRAELILPMTDATCFALAAPASAGPSLTFMPSLETLTLAADKFEVFRLAAKLGIPIPKTWEIADADTAGESSANPRKKGTGTNGAKIGRIDPLAHARGSQSSATEGGCAKPGFATGGGCATPENATYPLVVKPRRSHVREGGRLIALGVSYAHDTEEIRRILNDLPAGAFPVLLQEKLAGEGVGYFALARDGVPLAEFYHRRLREMPPTGGVSVLREAIAPDKEMEEAGRKLIAHLRWTGPVMVEFKRDDAGRPRLMEINGRFWGSLQLAIDAGVDFPALLVKAFRGETFAPPATRAGTRTRYLLGDLESLAIVLAKGKKALPTGIPDRRAYLKKFLTEGGRLELLRLSDPAPFFIDLARYVKKAATIFLGGHRRGLRGILHAHTTFSYDGVLPLKRFALHLRLRGLSFAAVTEHDNSMDVEKTREMVRSCEALSDEGMTLLPGIEFATERGTHILGLGVREYFESRDAADIVRRIKAQGGVAVLAHPDNGDFERDPAFLQNLDGVEIWNSGHDGPWAPSLKNIQALREIRALNPGVLAFAGLDFHEPGHYRGLRLEIDETHGAAEILRAIKEGRFRVKGRLFSFAPKDSISPAAEAYIRLIRAVVDFARPAVKLMRRLAYWRASEKTKEAERVRVLHAIETGNPGGAERVMLSIMDNLPRDNYRSSAMLRKEGWLKEQCTERGVPVDIVRLGSLWDLRFVLRAAGIFRRESICIFHSHEFYMNALGALAAAVARRAHIAVVHGNLNYIRPLHRKLFYRAALVLGTTFVTVSLELRREFCRILDVSKTRVPVVHNGVAIPAPAQASDAVAAREKLGVGSSPTVAMLASLYEVKGHAVLLDAMPALLTAEPDLKVLFVGRGDGAHEQSLRKKAAPFGDAVRFLGYREDVAELLPALDVLAVPSHYEGLSLSLCEAMAAGIPAVATRVGGNGEVIEDGVNGFLVPPSDPAALAEKIIALLQDEELRKRLGAAARQTAIEKFSIERMTGNYLDLYREVRSL